METDIQLFEKDKDYIFSFEKYREDCAKQSIPMGDWATKVNGARVNIKEDRTQGALHVYLNDPAQVMIVNGRPVQGRSEEAFLVLPEWCEERNI